jgi:hypothetical protein
VAGAGVEAESRRGRDQVAVGVLVRIDAVDVAEVVTVGWAVLLGGAGGDPADGTSRALG